MSRHHFHRPKKTRQACACRVPVRRPALQWDYVLRLWAFLTFTDGELDLLAFPQGLAAFANNVAEMNEDIALVFTCDKSVTFFVIEPFDGSDSSI
jgi:hypothetical protein